MRALALTPCGAQGHGPWTVPSTTCGWDPRTSIVSISPDPGQADELS